MLAQELAKPEKTSNLPPPHKRNHNWQPNAITQAKELQRIILQKAREPKVTAAGLSQLARAWSELEHRKRILRGVPDPGQFRPDLDANQLKRALKRFGSRQAGIVDIVPTALPEGCEAPEEEETAEESQE